MRVCHYLCASLFVVYLIRTLTVLPPILTIATEFDRKEVLKEATTLGCLSEYKRGIVVRIQQPLLFYYPSQAL